MAQLNLHTLDNLDSEMDLGLYFSNGLRVHSFDTPTNVLKDAISKNPTARIVSVGTGNGFFEKILEEILSIKIICVEPFPNEFNPLPKELLKVPEYSYTKELIENEDGIVSNCILILNWSDPVDSVYDYDAIMRLKPLSILWIGEENGSAGGYTFHNWLHTCEINKFLPYKKVQRITKEIHCDEYGLMIYTIALLEKIKLPNRI